MAECQQYKVNNNPEILSMQKEELQKLLKLADAMTSDLTSIKESISKNAVKGISHQSPSNIIVAATHQRALLRTLAETLENNRGLVQVNKQKIEKSRIVLEGLEYFKRTLKDKITDYHTEVQNIEEYLQEPLGDIDWQNDYSNGERRLKQSLEKLRAKDQAYRATLDKRTDLQKVITEKKKLYNSVLPKQIKKLHEQAVQTAKIFGIQANQVLQKIQNINLAYIYDTFKALKSVQKIQVIYGKQQYQFIQIIVKPSYHQNYEASLKYKIKLQQKQLKIRVASLAPDFNKLVIGIDRRSDFSNRDIFHRLINQQEIKPVFQQATTQSHRNSNNKYVYLKWLQSVLCASAVECTQFLQLIRQRVFSVSICKYIFQNIKTPHWLGAITQHLSAEVHNKRLFIENDQKITFQDFKQLFSVPPALRKSLNVFEQESRKVGFTASRPEFQRALNNRRSCLLQMLSKVCLEELIIPELNHYHKISVTYNGLKIQCVIIVPYEYPNTNPKVKIISVEKPYEQDYTNMANLQAKAKIDNKVTYSNEAEFIQDQTNFVAYNEETNVESFQMLFFIKRFLQSIVAVYHQIQQKRSTK